MTDAMRNAQLKYDNACPDEPDPTAWRCSNCQHEWDSNGPSGDECPKCGSDEVDEIDMAAEAADNFREPDPYDESVACWGGMDRP